MTNLEKFDVARIMQKISEAAPFMLLVMAFGTFLAVGIFWADYFKAILTARFTSSAGAMAIFLAIIHEAVRFGLLVASIRDFSDHKSFNGWLGLVASIGLVAHDVTVAGDVANLWANDLATAGTYKMMFIFLIVLGLVLELRLILTVEKASMGKPEGRKETNRKAEERTTADVAMDILLNGTGNGRH